MSNLYYCKSCKKDNVEATDEYGLLHCKECASIDVIHTDNYKPSLLKECFKNLKKLSTMNLIKELHSINYSSHGLVIEPVVEMGEYYAKIIPCADELTNMNVIIFIPMEEMLELNDDEIYIINDSSSPSMMGYGDDYGTDTLTIKEFDNKFFNSNNAEEVEEFIDKHFNNEYFSSYYQLVFGNIKDFDPDKY